MKNSITRDLLTPIREISHARTLRIPNIKYRLMNLAKPDIQYCSTHEALPEAAEFFSWAHCVGELIALEASKASRPITVRLVDCDEMTELNRQWRHKDSATNVLAFPFDDEVYSEQFPLGDIVICAPVVQKEADEQEKPFIDRLAHMFVHGMLHILGYNHISSAECEEMEALEREALSRLGYANPYE